MTKQFVFCSESRVACNNQYGVASMSRLFKIIGLFCKRAL